VKDDFIFAVGFQYYMRAKNVDKKRNIVIMNQQSVATSANFDYLTREEV
jgi:hypothetical protein